MKILFFGELYPDVVHGISISNRLNLDLLSQINGIDIDVIQEVSHINLINPISPTKIKSFLNSLFQICLISRKKKYEIFYLTISLSCFGLLKTVLCLYLYSLKRSGQIILHLHRGDFVEFYTKNSLYRLLVKLCFNRANSLIVLSELQKSEMSAYFPSNFIFVVENTVLEEKQLPVYKVKDSFHSRFIYISNYIEQKGIFDLLAAFEKIDGVELDCYGGFAGNEAELRCRECNRIRINPTIIGVKKFNAIHDSDALILPSWNEGQPTIILEAMLVGTPILTTKVGFIIELLGADYPFYFLPQNPVDLVDCIKKFISFENKSDLSLKLQARYFELFSQAHHRHKLYKAFFF